jgi:hypothetical protein
MAVKAGQISKAPTTPDHHAPSSEKAEPWPEAADIKRTVVDVK